jgi:hypothetical protein
MGAMIDWAGEYLIRVAGKGLKARAHLWDGDDTVCRMWSTGGLAKRKYSVQRKDLGLPVCSMCVDVLERLNPKAEFCALGDVVLEVLADLENARSWS